jgi:hypothetical protein
MGAPQAPSPTQFTLPRQAASLLVLDWSRRHVVAHGSVEEGLARSAYGAFVAQGPVLVLGALLLRLLEIPGDLKFLLLAALGVAGSFACGWVASGRAQPLRGG